jgi:maleylpyruvate isomerase
VKLYSYYRSTSAWRVRIVLALKGLEYEYVAVNLTPGVSAQQERPFSDVNPFRQVPTLEWMDGGRVVRLSQSVAIAEYLEECHPAPPLFPRDTLARARVRQAVEAVNSGIQPHQNSATLSALGKLTGEAEVKEWTRNAITRGLEALEALASAHGGKHSVGDEVSLADAYLVPQLYNARRFDVDVDRYPKLLEVEARALTLDAFESAHPDRQPDSPARKTPKAR